MKQKDLIDPKFDQFSKVYYTSKDKIKIGPLKTPHKHYYGDTLQKILLWRIPPKTLIFK